MDYLTVGGGGEQCVAYRDEICAQYLSNQTVLVQSAEKQRINSKRLHNLVAAIGSDFKTLSLQCLRHAMFALCVYTYPLCDLDKQQDQIVRKRMVSDWEAIGKRLGSDWETIGSELQNRRFFEVFDDFVSLLVVHQDQEEN